MISLAQLKLVLGEFLDQQVLAYATNSLTKWSLGGASVLVLNNLEKVLTPYKTLLISLGISDDSLNINKETCKVFLDNAFKTTPELKITLLGNIFTFTKADADALLSIMGKYNGD